MKNILNIAEKPSIARQISKILGKPPKIIRTLSPFNPVYEFQLPHQQSLMRFTSVRGHVMQLKFQKDLSDWSSYDPRILFTQKIKKEVGVGNQKIIQNIQYYLEDAEEIILWLDCDLEGEAIAGEVSQLCLKYNPHVTVKRARFSSLSPKEIWYAVTHLDQLKTADVKAVEYRQQLDFRVGCAMTNLQTLILKRERADSGKPINFGTCLIPIINLVVQRYLQRRLFQSTNYWRINLQYGKIWFTWAEEHNFERKENAYTQAEQIKYACIVKIQKQTIFKKRPLPLDTSTLLKHCSRVFKIESLKIMEIAERLYQQGFISYPRTETNRYPKGLDLVEITKKFENQQKYKEMVEYVLKSDKIEGRYGKDSDGAHSPIYPLQVKTEFKGGAYEQSIYDYIVTTFLASISKDTEIQENRIIIKANTGYHFSLKKAKVVDKGYQNIIKPLYSKEQKDDVMPSFLQGQNIEITRARVVEFQTQPPTPLTEATLIELMEVNKIGTDATIPEHISNIQIKGFAEKIEQEFYPTKLGLALIQSYKFIDNPLGDTKLRAKMEENVKKITQDEGSYQKIYSETINEFLAAYDHLMKNQNEFLEMFGKFINVNMIKEQEKQIEDLCCHNCQTTLKLSKRSLVCSRCSLRYFLPKQGEIKLLKNQECFKCKSKIMSVQKGEVTYKICPRCFNYPEPHMIGPNVFKESPEDPEPQNVRLPCFTCRISDCVHSGHFKISTCSGCKEGHLKLRATKAGKYLIGCSDFPKCRVLITFSSYVNKVQVSDQQCESCSTETQKVRKCKVIVGKTGKEAFVCVHPNCQVKRSYVKVMKM